jgi:hypothetical protein
LRGKAGKESFTAARMIQKMGAECTGLANSGKQRSKRYEAPADAKAEDDGV